MTLNLDARHGVVGPAGTASPERPRAAHATRWRFAIPVGLALAAATQPATAQPESGFGRTLRNLFNPSQPQLPDAQNAPGEEPDDFVCPRVEVLDGTAALRAYTGAQASGTLRHQISIANVARECQVSGNTVTVKIGVEGRVLLGPAGAAGTFTAPVRFVVKTGDRVLASRVQRVSVTVRAGETGASFVVVEPGLTVAKGDIDILVGLDGASGEPRRARR